VDIVQPCFRKRNLRIDFLRGVSILLVLIHHFSNAYKLQESSLALILPKQWIIALVRNGNYGVILFFVISGFLITSTSLNRYRKLSNLKALSFYRMRFARIFPCLLLFFSVVILFNFTPFVRIQKETDTVSLATAVFSVLTFWHNVLMEKFGYFNYCLNVL